MQSLSVIPAIKIEDIIENNKKNTVVFDRSRLELDGIAKIVRSLKLENDDMGIYIIFKNNIESFDNIIYIGKAGTVEQKGIFKGQTLKGRLTNSRNNQSARLYFREKFTNNPNINHLVIMCCIVDIQLIPSYIEACLLQDFYNQKKRLPDWNAEF